MAHPNLAQLNNSYLHKHLSADEKVEHIQVPVLLVR